MKRNTTLGWVLASFVALGLAGCAGAGSDGEVAAPAHDPHVGGGRFTERAGEIELFATYPHQIAGVESEEPWQIHLTSVANWKPVEDASVTLTMTGPGRARAETAVQSEVPGVYMATPTLPQAGAWQATFALSVADDEYEIQAGPLEVFESESSVDSHAGHDHGDHEGHDHEDHEGHDHEDHEGHDHEDHEGHDHEDHEGHDHGDHEGHDHEDHEGHDHEDHEGHDHEDHEGHDHGDHEGHDHEDHEGHDHEDHEGHDHEEADSGLITLSVEEQWTFPFAVAVAEEREIRDSFSAVGELVAPPGGLVHVSAPVAGLVQVDGPSLGPGDFVRTGQLLALIAPIRLDNSYELTRAEVVAAEREVERAERLLEAGAIPARRLQDARLDLEVAVAAFEAIRGGTPGRAGEEADSELYRLLSPIDGMVAARDVALGQQVEVGEHAFTIVNTGTLWFVARIPARYAADTGRIRGAWFTVEGGTSPYTVSRVLSVGSMIEPTSRTLPVRFAVPNRDRALKVGMLAEGQILVGDPVRGAAVPVAAIQDEDGLPVIYVKVSGDTFERRVVEVGPSDGSWTLVASGIEAAEHVVTEGAYQVNLAALGTIEPSHGHAH